MKLLGIGAGAVAGAAIAAVAGKDGGNPVTPPRSPEDVIKGPKPYRGPDSVEDGDFIRKRPDIIPPQEEIIRIPPLTPEQHQWIVDGQKVLTFEPDPGWYKVDLEPADLDNWNLEPGSLIPVIPCPNHSDTLQTSGSGPQNVTITTTDAVIG